MFSLARFVISTAPAAALALGPTLAIAPAFAALARPAARISDPDYRSRGLNRTSSRLNRRIEARISHSSVGVGASLLDGGCNLLQVVGQTEAAARFETSFSSSSAA